MSRKSKPRSRAKRPLDLNGMKAGRYATVAEMSIPASGHPVTPEALHAKLQLAATDLRNASPDRAPVSLVVDWQSDIRFQAVVMALPQGALSTAVEEAPTSSTVHRDLEESALAEAEEIAAATRQTSKAAIDIGNAMAAEGERWPIPMNELVQTMARSPDESVSRATYGRARGPEAHIHYPDGERTIGGAKIIPTTTHSAESFDLQQCSLKVIKPGVLELACLVPHEDWRRLQSHTAGINVVKGEADSAIHNSLLVAAKAGIHVDMTVCVSEKITTGERWCTPIAIKNKQDVFIQGHEWLSFLEESLGP